MCPISSCEAGAKNQRGGDISRTQEEVVLVALDD
jgi:hypothetical protein